MGLQPQQTLANANAYKGVYVIQTKVRKPLVKDNHPMRKPAVYLTKGVGDLNLFELEEFRYPIPLLIWVNSLNIYATLKYSRPKFMILLDCRS